MPDRRTWLNGARRFLGSLWKTREALCPCGSAFSFGLRHKLDRELLVMNPLICVGSDLRSWRLVMMQYFLSV